MAIDEGGEFDGRTLCLIRMLASDDLTGEGDGVLFVACVWGLRQGRQGPPPRTSGIPPKLAGDRLSEIGFCLYSPEASGLSPSFIRRRFARPAVCPVTRGSREQTSATAPGRSERKQLLSPPRGPEHSLPAPLPAECRALRCGAPPLPHFRPPACFLSDSGLEPARLPHVPPHSPLPPGARRGGENTASRSDGTRALGLHATHSSLPRWKALRGPRSTHSGVAG